MLFDAVCFTTCMCRGEAVVFPTDSDDLNEFFPTNLPTAKGMSGAPVLLEDKVAGVLCNSDAEVINVI
jgi:hypothetical protein